MMNFGLHICLYMMQGLYVQLRLIYFDIIMTVHILLVYYYDIVSYQIVVHFWCYAIKWS